jgi:signal recognition particle subunit SRP9
MVYVEDFDEFMSRVESLYRSDPSRFRYTVKIRQSDNKLVLKATDDETCLKYRAGAAGDTKRVERMNGFLMRLMTQSS